MRGEDQVRSLRRQVALLSATLFLVLGGWVAGRILRPMQHWIHAVQAGNELKIRTDDGPYLVFGVATKPNSGPKLWAVLPEPLAIVDSAGGSIDLSKLKWKDIHGEPAAAPTDQALRPLYVRADEPQ